MYILQAASAASYFHDLFSLLTVFMSGIHEPPVNLSPWHWAGITSGKTIWYCIDDRNSFYCIYCRLPTSAASYLRDLFSPLTVVRCVISVAPSLFCSSHHVYDNFQDRIIAGCCQPCHYVLFLWRCSPYPVFISRIPSLIRCTPFPWCLLYFFTDTFWICVVLGSSRNQPFTVGCTSDWFARFSIQLSQLLNLKARWTERRGERKGMVNWKVCWSI